MDHLQEMFLRQKDLARNFIPIDYLANQEVPAEERQKYLQTYWQLLIEEAVEFLREIPARKFWRPSVQNKPLNMAALKEELADIWHILIAITLLSGVDALEMFDLYVVKNEINKERVINKS